MRQASALSCSWRRGCFFTIAAVIILFSAIASAQILSSSGKDSEIPGVILSIPKISDVYRNVQSWLDSWAPLRDMPKEERLQLLIEENEWKNDLVMFIFPRDIRTYMPRIVQSWLRCWIACFAVYFFTGALWAYYTYYVFGNQLFKPGTIPHFKDIMEQMKVSNLAMPMYSMLPAVTEFCAEQGWTMAYPRIENVGLPRTIMYYSIYMFSVEFGVYWMHRLLHDIKWAYKHLHHTHHKYNKANTLSPFAGLAFHPIDGILQAVPYTWSMFFCPMHFLTHEIMLFFTGLWTTNIHDALHGKVYPILGAGYHTIHHTTYKHNYGHYTILFDYLFGSLTHPEDLPEDKGGYGPPSHAVPQKSC